MSVLIHVDCNQVIKKPSQAAGAGNVGVGVGDEGLRGGRGGVRVRLSRALRARGWGEWEGLSSDRLRCFSEHEVRQT